MDAISIATKRFHTASMDDSVSMVQDLFKSQNISFVPVVDAKGSCFGVISQKDLVHFHQESRNVNAELAWEICTHNVIEVHPTDAIEKLVSSVLDNGVHHLVVADEGRIQGVISSVDVIRAMQEEKHTQAKAG